MKNIIITLCILISYNTLFSQNEFLLKYENGETKVKGTLIDGQKNGIWEAYDSEGKLIIKREYLNNILVKNHLDHISFDSEKLKQEDVLWSKRIERIIPINKAKNNPIYQRQYLRLLLLNKIHNNKLISYNNMNFDSILTKEIALKKVAKMDYSSSNFTIKEDWFFNKKTNSMQVLIVGLSIKGINKIEEISFYFPELLEKVGEENLFIDERKITFEDYFENRLFESEITKETTLIEREMTTKRAKEIDKLLIDTEIHYWFKNN